MRDDARANGPIWWTPADVCHHFQISMRTLDKWTEQFKLPWSTAPGSRVRRIKKTDVEEFERQHFHAKDRTDRQ